MMGASGHDLCPRAPPPLNRLEEILCVGLEVCITRETLDEELQGKGNQGGQ